MADVARLCRAVGPLEVIGTTCNWQDGHMALHSPLPPTLGQGHPTHREHRVCYVV